MSQLNKTISSAIRKSIVEFKALMTTYTVPNQNLGAFAVNVFRNNKNGEITADVAFWEDPTKRIFFYCEGNPNQVRKLWSLGKGSAETLRDVAQAFIDKDWVQEL